MTTMGNGEEIKQYQQEIQLTGLDEETYQKCLETVGVSKEKRNDAFAIVSGSPEEYEKNDYLYLVEDEVGLFWKSTRSSRWNGTSGACNHRETAFGIKSFDFEQRWN